MGTTHSSENDERRDRQSLRHRTRLESTLDMIYGACPCEFEFDPDAEEKLRQQGESGSGTYEYNATKMDRGNAGTRSRIRQENDEELDDGLMKHFFPPSSDSSSPSPFISRSFNLNKLHPSQGPYLGSSEWVPLSITEGDENMDDDQQVDELEERNLLNISDVAQGQGPDESMETPITPPRIKSSGKGLNSRDFDHRILSTPSFLLQHSHSFSSPRLRRNPSFGSMRSHLSGSTFRTATTTSDDSNDATDPDANHCSGGKVSKRYRENANEVTITFTPRRLFGNDTTLDDSYSDHWSHNQDRHHDQDQGTTTSRSNAKNTTSSATTKSSHLLGSEFLEPPREQFPMLQPRPSSYIPDLTSIGTPSQEHDLTMTTTSNYTYGNSLLDNTSSPRVVGTSCDQSSIIVRNGVLHRERTPASPTLSTYKGFNANVGSTRDVPDGIKKNGLRHINTLPSFCQGKPIRLKIKESYAGFSTVATIANAGSSSDDPTDTEGEEDGTSMINHRALDLSNISLLSDAEQAHFFSYDPYFSMGQYLISTMDDKVYGNGLVVKMGEQYMTLQDGNGRVWSVMRSRHTFIPSAVVYSPNPRYLGQTPSSHRPSANIHHNHPSHFHASSNGTNNQEDDGGVELYPWALVKKHGRRMDHDVSIHLVAGMSATSSDLVGGLFEKEPTFRSRHGFDDQDGHSHTIVYRVNSDDHEEIPCCLLIRDPIQRDLFEITIAPGIDPLLIICYMAVHSKMDVEPKLSDL